MLSIHTMTTKPWSLGEAVDGYARAGVRGITVWRQHLAGTTAEAAGTRIRDAGLTCTALCRGGFFPAHDRAARQAAIDDNRKAIAEAHAVGAPMVVLVCGAVVGMPLAEARAQIADGIAAVLPDAKAAGVRLAIEPLHPLYAADRSAVNTMAQARRIAERFSDTCADPRGDFGSAGRKLVGIAVDVYHVWWDDALADEIAISGRLGLLHGFHTCDWKAQQAEMLNDRGVMGEGAIDLRGIRAQMQAAGFAGWTEVEIFSAKYWAQDQAAYVEMIKAAYAAHA